MSVRSARYNLLSLRNPKGLTVIPEERDAWAFLDAAKITSSRQQRAVVDLVRGLKHAQLWSKMKAIYPFIGGTATTHKFNLKDPRDVDAAFRLVFSGGWTHSATGADPNGTNAYADTFYIPKDQATLGSVSYGIYNRENTTAGLNDMGCGIPAGNQAHMAMLSRLSNTFYGDCWSNGVGRISTSLTDRRGLLLLSRTTSSSMKAFRNGTQLGSTNTNSQSQSDLDFLTMKLSISAFTTNALTQINFNDSECAFAFLGDGLTDANVTALYNIVQRFQTSLGRQV